MYLPPDAKQLKDFCDTVKNCNPRCGIKFPALNAYFKKGDWNHIKERIILNKPGQSNGNLELWINGIKRIDYSKIIFRVSNNVTIRGFTVVSFFGGDRSFATKIDTYTLYKNFTYYDY